MKRLGCPRLNLTRFKTIADILKHQKSDKKLNFLCTCQDPLQSAIFMLVLKLQWYIEVAVVHFTLP